MSSGHGYVPRLWSAGAAQPPETAEAAGPLSKAEWISDGCTAVEFGKRLARPSCLGRVQGKNRRGRDSARGVHGSVRMSPAQPGIAEGAHADIREVRAGADRIADECEC